MRTCAPTWGRGGLALRSAAMLLLIPPFLLGLRLLVAGPRSPRAGRVGAGEGEGEAAVAFSVISIEPERSAPRGGTLSRRGPGPEEEEEEEEGVEVEVADGERREPNRAYEDENEIHWRQVSGAAREMKFNGNVWISLCIAAEELIFIEYITTIDLWRKNYFEFHLQ